MKGINKVILVGTLGRDPELKTLQSGQFVASMSVATSESWTDKASGEKQEKTEWHKVTMWGKVAEIAGRYLKKGSQVYLEGKLQTRKWQDKEGQDRYSTEVVADQMQMLGGKGSGTAQEGANGYGAALPPNSVPQNALVDDSHGFSDDVPF